MLKLARIEFYDWIRDIGAYSKVAGGGGGEELLI